MLKYKRPTNELQTNPYRTLTNLQRKTNPYGSPKYQMRTNTYMKRLTYFWHINWGIQPFQCIKEKLPHPCHGYWTSNYYLLRELFWPLELRIYIFRPMRMTDAILPGWPPRQHKRPCIAPSTSFLFLLASSKTEQSTRERTFSLSLSLWQIPAANRCASQHERAHSTLFCFL